MAPGRGGASASGKRRRTDVACRVHADSEEEESVSPRDKNVVGERLLRRPSAVLPALAQKTRLNDGRLMPLVGLGVYRVPRGRNCYNAVKWALERGYRLIDTAAMYQNEGDVGRALRDSAVPRDEVWITTKILPRDHGRERARDAGLRSLKTLGLDYVDLLLIHSPTGGKVVETWDALHALRQAGHARSIGVSNFGPQHLAALEAHRPESPAAVNQIEMHPLVYTERQETIAACRRSGILLQAYGSLFSGSSRHLRSRQVQLPAKMHGKTAALVLLRWALQLGFAIIPKSSRHERVRENADLDGFALSDVEMDALCGMSGDLGEYWNPLTSKVDLGDVRRRG
eukprot:CAMPEP_0117468680 /NCGR_PEP_ID=MMETSP0784-20121206/6302_1 /TAXON_ID=39447 /ORGANISM="" /LENGTH=341 /DNA_ID=CAMNT_0005262699 /DNA_START=36 /DNA_END=1061 /DNA_ORIENTATION=+